VPHCFTSPSRSAPLPRQCVHSFCLRCAARISRPRYRSLSVTTSGNSRSCPLGMPPRSRCPPQPPNMSKNEPNGSPPPPPPWPLSMRLRPSSPCWSYTRRFSSSVSTSYARLHLAHSAGSPPLSGCLVRLASRNARFTSDDEADRATPRILYRSSACAIARHTTNNAALPDVTKCE
jgi:hypothetical protein